MKELKPRFEIGECVIAPEETSPFLPIWKGEILDVRQSGAEFYYMIKRTGVKRWVSEWDLQPFKENIWRNWCLTYKLAGVSWEEWGEETK